MSRRDKRKTKKRSEPRRYTILASARSGLSRSESTDRRRWPIIASYVPDPDVWRVTGCGIAAIFRQIPDGRVASALFDIELMHGGIKMMYGKDDHASLDDALGLLEIARKHAPPCVPGEPDLAARYVYGAYALGLDMGFDFPAEQRRPYFSLLPMMAGTKNWWLQQLTHDDLTPARLVEIVRAIDAPDEVPEDKEMICLTTAIFDVDDGQAACEKLAEHHPEFAYDDEDDQGYEVFTFTREYPKNHWSPLASLGGRQILGNVRIRATELQASAQVLSMAARLVTRLKQVIGGSIRLRGAEWKNVEEMMREHQVGH
ncbi:MAG: hypothetical protein ACREJC_10975 [Tepidisphaeraceae bacterium]